MAHLSKKTLQKLYEDFDTMDILYAIDRLDEIRSIVADDVRDRLLKLHKIGAQNHQ